MWLRLLASLQLWKQLLVVFKVLTSSSHFFFLLLLIFALNSLFLYFLSLRKFFCCCCCLLWFLGFRSTIAGNHGSTGESLVTPLSPCMIRVTVVASRFLSSTMAFSEGTSHFQSLGLFNSCSPFGYRENITAKQVKKQNRVFFFFFFETILSGFGSE